MTLLPARNLTVDDDGPADFRVIRDAIDAAVAGAVRPVTTSTVVSSPVTWESCPAPAATPTMTTRPINPFLTPSIPLPGEAFAYLVTAVIAAVEQSPGFDSGGLERALPAPCP